ncbi:MAG: hypothetical protein WCZ66_10885 [Sphingomonadaceae bacterium]
MGELHIDQDDKIAVFRFDNPPLGFLDGAMTSALEEGLDHVLGQPGTRAIILTGAQDGVFIRHFDLPELSQSAEALAASARLRRNGRGFAESLAARTNQKQHMTR